MFTFLPESPSIHWTGSSIFDSDLGFRKVISRLVSYKWLVDSDMSLTPYYLSICAMSGIEVSLHVRPLFFPFWVVLLKSTVMKGWLSLNLIFPYPIINTEKSN